ncbi:EcsC family protein [Flavimarina sp. Hel_I_48]|uniref:EcsC family protein n=1 Tax=Flavimarina sp. Hel_I_48 TaxID=1392488 RepID=UPI0004DED773|nr:EcsC family protein [Flavimarina sp. Hel_I_48]
MTSQSLSLQHIAQEDLQSLKKAKYDLEHVSFLMRAFNTIGTPIDSGLAMIPEKYQDKVQHTIQQALRVAVKANLKTMNNGKTGQKSLNTMYKMVTGFSGAAGGFLGVAGFTADLLFTTKFMMRSILDIARSQGEDVYAIETQLACLEVFALGGTSEDDDELDTSYYATRAALRSAMSHASTYIANNGTSRVIETLAAQSSAPLAKVIGQVSARYSLQVSEKFMAQLLPVVGGVAGASINVLFIAHFQKMATAHFTLRRLERKYGRSFIQGSYAQLSA